MEGIWNKHDDDESYNCRYDRLNERMALMETHGCDCIIYKKGFFLNER